MVKEDPDPSFETLEGAEQAISTRELAPLPELNSLWYALDAMGTWRVSTVWKDGYVEVRAVETLDGPYRYAADDFHELFRPDRRKWPER